MNKIQLDKLIKPLVKIYDDIELEIIKDVLFRLNNYDGVSGTLEWYLDKLKEIGTIDVDTLRLFKKDKKKIKNELSKILNAASSNINDLDKLNQYYEEGKIKINPNNITKSEGINNLIREALKDTISITNLIPTKAIEATKEAYRTILNTAYAEVSSGIYTYNESIRRATNKMAKEGIKLANYESGKSYSIESVVRRDVITRVNKLVGDVTIENCKKLGTNLVYVDQHLGARVRTKYMKEDYEAHAEWQGKKYMIEGSSDKYPNLYEATGYGEMLGLKGLNCYHDFRPTWEWENIPDEIDEIKNAEAYERFQQQRSYERKIRGLKRKLLVSKENKDKENISKIKKTFNETNKEFNSWLENNNLLRDYNREYISNKANVINYSDLEQTALNYYFSPSSITLNEKLRNHKELTKEEKEIVKNLDNALLKTPNYEGFIVRDLEIKDIKTFMNDIAINTTYSTNQYLSFSNGKRFNEYANVRIYIEKSKNAKDLTKINSIGEQEVLYERNRKFKTLNIKEKDGIIYVLWEEVE